jgi:hypothetical protein
MNFSRPVASLIQQRYSCRDYRASALPESSRLELVDFINTLPAGPFNTPSRFQLITSTADENNALKGLGTYGSIRNPAGYIAGVTNAADKDLEDFGYRLEEIILRVTDLGLSTCWLGGLFTRSGFSKSMGAIKGETIPAISSIGVASEEKSITRIELKRSRLNWEELFFDKVFGNPLNPENSGAYGNPLEMVRLAPSARNKQPWRIVKNSNTWHFYLQRTKGYREMVMSNLTGIPDLQRLDMGIAMVHFELSAAEAGLSGKWQINEPDLQKPDALTEYTVSWVSSNGAK